ncbi:phage tail tape measure protein [Paenarthrobacter ureafaciens]|uniref:phage tail tape measure protein n=1 Tax=Paenarthrobacter ureafaciens TaxID=37931 RepID=UPI0014075837|nr:phage tail tape measure protein [Paenarthrobacter ureafaciens]MCX8455360.1 phage tail tape measure protein [Paenarthrobacter ureafaciens]MCY0974087.1 phage tail tape measure protein [Paenarthrobacter ureafaciens]
MADRSISIALEARVQGFVAGMRTAQQAANDFASRTAAFARENEEHFDRVGKASAIMGGALLAGFGLAVKRFMEFDAAMSEVQASTHETAGNMELLRNAAIEAGADTSFSAKEAAQAIDELAKAGVSTKDILNGGLKGAMSLAAAGSLEVADAAEIAATALTQFKLSGQDIPHLADLLAAGAGKAQGSVEDIGNALKQSGLVASQFGLSVEDTTGTLAAFASAGLIGSDSGTSFKTMLLSLAKPAKETQSLMNELGISAYDAEGKFVGITNLAEQLKTKLGGLTQAQRDAALAQIFGTDAIRAANVLYQEGAKGIQGWIDQVNEAGYAAVTASIKQDNLAGDLEKLGGSFDSVLIKGGSGAAQALRGLVQGAEDMVDAIGKIPTPILNAAVGIAGMTGGTLLLAGAVLTALPRLVEFHASFNRIAPAGSRARSAITGVGKAAGGAVAALLALQVASAVFSTKETKSAEDYGQALLKLQKNAKGGAEALSSLDTTFQGWNSLAGAAPGINSAADAIKRLANQNFTDVTLNKGLDGFREFVTGSKGDIGQLEDRMKGLGEQMGNLAKNGGAETAAAAFRELTAEFEKNGKGAKEALEYLPGYKDALQSLATQAGVTLSEQDLLDFAMGRVPASMQKAEKATQTYITAAGDAAPVTEEMAKALEDVGLSAYGSVADLEKFADALFNAGNISLSASDSVIAYEAALDALSESVLKNGKTLDLNTEQGRNNQSAYNDIAKAAMATAEAQAAETLAAQGSAAAQSTLQGSLQASYRDLVNAAGQLGITGDAADTMARKALGIPKNIPIETWVKDFATEKLDAVKAKADALNGKVSTVTIQTIQETYNRVINGGPDPNRPGQIAPMATGGRVRGPGTGTSDEAGYFALSDGEYVLRESAARAIGYDRLDRINGGATHEMRPMGYQYAPAGAPAVTRAPAPAAAPQQAPPVYVQNPFTGDYLLARVDSRAAGVVAAADSGSAYLRKGR